MLGGILACLVVVGLGIEATYGKQIEHLLVHLFLRVDDGVDHLLGICIHRRQVHREIYLRTLRRACDVHQAIYSNVVGRERTSDTQVAQRNAIYGIFCLQVEWCIVWVSAKGDGSAWHKLEVLLDDILDGEFIYAVVNHIVAEHIE